MEQILETIFVIFDCSIMIPALHFEFFAIWDVQGQGTDLSKTSSHSVIMFTPTTVASPQLQSKMRMRPMLSAIVNQTKVSQQRRLRLIRASPASRLFENHKTSITNSEVRSYFHFEDTGNASPPSKHHGHNNPRN